jgi:PAS domain S-box-containing protein
MNLIYLLEKSTDLTTALQGSLEQAGYVLQSFSSINDVESNLAERKPAAVILDDGFDENNSIKEMVGKLKEAIGDGVPVIMVSDNDDVESRLEAIRAGGSQYLSKPVEEGRLIRALGGLETQSDKTPYRILLIDDDEALLGLFAAILEQAGMLVETESNPLRGLEVLAEFKPDVLLTDVHMPDCSGPELVQIIRQQKEWDMLPITYLSSESDLDSQLEAMELGADNFLAKNMEKKSFVAVITAMAKRSRLIHRLQNNLQASKRENEFQIATMNHHDIVSIADIAGRITFVNDKFCEISGYSREELLGNNHRLLKSDRHTASFYQEMWDSISNGKVWHGAICNKRKDGQEYWVESTIVPFLDGKGKPYKYVSARTDVTALRVSEERLHRSQTFAKIGTWDWNIKTGELYWSDQIGPLFGYEEEVPETTYDNFLAAVHPDDRQRVMDAVKKCVEEGDTYDIEHRVIWPDGSEHWVHESGDVTRSEDGEALHMIGVVRDISARKHVEQKLIYAREEAENASLAKSQFLSSMSHELRTPLNAIIGFGQLLELQKDPALSGSQQGNVDEILRAGHHLLELINEVLDLSKIESGRIDLCVEPVGVFASLSESLRLITPLAQKRGVEITMLRNGEVVSLEDALTQDCFVQADRTRLKQVLLNLLSNAVKYNVDDGKIVIDCFRKKDDQIRVRIEDTGVGLTLDQQSKLFQPFVRFENDRPEVEGAGIGLVICKKIIEHMGGEIGHESKQGVGSTFWIDIPDDQLVAGANDDVSEVENMPGKDTKENRKNVLYIEDNPANLRLVTQALERLSNVNMLGAPDPYLGLELAVEHKPDLILLDINLPGMSGFEVLEKLRRQDSTCATPVIAISADAMPEAIEKGKAAGFDDYVTKPINVPLFMQAVDKVL